MAKIVWGNLARQIGTRDVAAAALRPAVIAVYGFSGNRAVITTLTTNRINDAIALIRNSTFPARGYGRLASFFRDSYAASTNFPTDLMERRWIAEQRRLGLSFGWDSIPAKAIFPRSQGIPMPFNSVVLPSDEFQPLATASLMLRC